MPRLQITVYIVGDKFKHTNTKTKLILYMFNFYVRLSVIVVLGL